MRFHLRSCLGCGLGFKLAPLLGWAALIFFAAAGSTRAEEAPLRVMTYNLRYASPRPPNAWQDRRPVSKAMIDQYRPDIIGTQEGLYHQLRQMAEDLPDFEWIGLGREGGSRGEFMAVFYRRDRLEPQEFDHFWLSDEPARIGSATWGNTLPRMVTWVLFKDLKTGERFYHFNTHFDHQSQPARDKSAELLIARVRGRKLPLPVIVTGDFNQAQGASSYKTLLTEDGTGYKLADTWELAGGHVGNQIATFHDFKGGNTSDERIDWILVSPGFGVNSIEVVTFNKDGQYPSDHYPVLSEVRYPPSAAAAESGPQN